jgi:hypothetical protein
MKKVWNYLTQHLREDFHLLLYGTVFLFLAIAIYINYKIDFQDSVVNVQPDTRKPFYYLLLFSCGYYFTLLIYSAFTKQWDFWKLKRFWIKSILVLTLLSIDSSAPFLRTAINEFSNPKLQFWIYKVSLNLMSFFTVMSPLLIYYFLYDRKEKHVYGLSARQFDTKPYCIMLLIMLPIIIVASFHISFMNQYPMYKHTSAHEYLNVPEWVTALTYEAAYGSDFVNVEFLFRGFMVIGMMNILGRKAVLAMAVTYCFLHFGKPAGEAISSIFGGYILGVIAYETKSIWGGIIVHVGIAWMMELVAFAGQSMRD